jgi:hypothetical protein
MEVVMTYNRSVVHNLVPTKKKENSAEIFKKKFIILDILFNT